MSPAPSVPHSVLFACAMNAVRSPMAAAMLTHFSGGRIRATSAGVRAGYPDPYMVAVMDEIGIDLSDHEPQTFEALGDATFELIITLAPEAHHHAVELTRVMAADVEYWPTPDATIEGGAVSGSREERLARYRAVRDVLFSHIKRRFALEGAPVV